MMLTQFAFMLFLVPSMTDAGFFMQIFADAGLEVTCPSGNLVYINPISEDLQQCEQQLGAYNESTCPGGTACERFPVLVPGYQDYCCWANKTITEGVEVKSSTTKESQSFSRRGSPDRGVVEAIIERPQPQESDEKEEGQEEVSATKTKVRTTTSQPEDEDSSEWDKEEERHRSKRPRNRKPTTTTVSTTTTTKMGSQGLPQCNDPSNSVFIDYGNRLRDCYFQRCERGYNCEFNKRIRRFICCGQDLGLVPPPGLPMLPAPKPLNPRRGPRPNPRPYGMQSDGPEDANNSIRSQPRGRSSCCDLNDCSGERNWEDDCRKQNTRCSNGQGFPSSRCQKGGSSRERLIEHPREQPRPQQRFSGAEWPGSDCSTRPDGCSETRGPANIERGNPERYEWLQRRVGPSEPSRTGCNMNSGAEGCPQSRNGGLQGSSFMEVGGYENFNRKEGPMPFDSTATQRPPLLQEFVDEKRREFSSVPNFPPRPFDDHRRAAVSSSLIPLKMNRLSPVHEGRLPSPLDRAHVTSSVPQEFNPFIIASAFPLPREANTKRTPISYSRQGSNVRSCKHYEEDLTWRSYQGVSRRSLPEVLVLMGYIQKNERIVCAAGSEYNLDGLIPSCNSENSDFCPSSHPHCSLSTSAPHRVCCGHVISQQMRLH